MPKISWDESGEYIEVHFFAFVVYNIRATCAESLSLA